MDSGLLALFVLFPKEKEKKKKTGNLGPRTTHSLASLDHKQLTSWKLSNLDDMSPCYILVASSCYREDFSGARRGLRKETASSNLLGTSRTSLWDVDASSMWDPRKGTLLPFRERTNCYLPLFPAQPATCSSSAAGGVEVRPPYQKTKLSLWYLFSPVA